MSVDCFRPEPTEYGAYYQRYIDAVPRGDPFAILARQVDQLRASLGRVRGASEHHRYAQGKWTIREVVGHMSDVERIFGYRALRIARGDTTELPGFDQDEYMAVAGYDHRSLDDLLDEFSSLRRANLLMLRALKDTDWTQMGSASGSPVSVRALLYLLLGHVHHHIAILEDRYLHTLNPDG